MPPINRVQINALRQAGAIDDNQYNAWLSRIEAGTTVDVSQRFLDQANQLLTPATLPSPAAQAASAVLSPENLRNAIRGIPGVGGAVQGIQGLAGLFQGQPNPAFQQAAGRPEVAPRFPTAPTTAPGGGTAPTDAAQTVFDLTAPAPGTSASVTLPEGRFSVDGRTFLRVQTGFDQNGLPQYDTIDLTGQTNTTAQQERQARTSRQQQLEDQAAAREFAVQQAQHLQQAQLQQTAASALLNLYSQPGGEFLARSIQQRAQGTTPTFNPQTDLRNLSPQQFADMFRVSGGGGGGVGPSANTQLTSQRTGVPVGQLQNTPAALVGGAPGGGIAATGRQQLTITPNIRQLMNLTGLQAEELGAIAPQLFGQSLEDLTRQSRRLAPPSAGRPAASFR